MRPSASTTRLRALAAAAICLPLLAGCNLLLPESPKFAPFLGQATVKKARSSQGRLGLTLVVNTVFASRDDEKADEKHVFKELRVALLGTGAAARLRHSSSDLRSNGADGAYQDESVWTDTWRVVLPAPPPSVRGLYLLVLTGCRPGASDCSRTVVPVCVRRGRISGEPSDHGNIDASGFGRDPQWRKFHTCKHPRFGYDLGAANEGSRYEHDAPKLPADLAARVR